VADILLSLLPQLELFAETSGLPNAVAASHHVELLSNDAWTAVATTFFPSNSVNDDWMSQSATPSFVDRWTVVMASGAMAVLTSQILQIPRFSATGAAQLACDMGLLGDIERLVLPALLDQLNRPSTVDVERVAEILTIFKCLDRADVVSGQYAAVRPAAIHRLWLSLETGPRPLNLSDFYADVAAFLGREWLTIGLVFGHDTGPSVWLSLLQATLQPCALSSCINVHNVCAWFDQSCGFAQSLLTNYGDVAENHSPVLAPAIVQVIFEPYWPLFESFATVERSEVLALQVRELVVPKSGPVDADFAALVEEATTGLWAALEVRVQFGLSFALGALLPAVVAAITDTVAEFELALVH
ncbi:hypothetical protein DYB31_013310, partial [Aphanomyces astaci]